MRIAGPSESTGGGIHPQLEQALELLRCAAPDDIDLHTLSAAVGLSPDHLGRLFKRHSGVAFSVMVRWIRLLRGLDHVADGASITDAAHLSGFADGAHANRVCWELGGAAPSSLLRAFGHARAPGQPSTRQAGIAGRPNSPV
jgi:transcriptional regulator GlxA family with amidase domain